MKRLLLASMGFYVIATALGLLLRLSFVIPVGLPSFSNALHAHSHTLYFGWGALGAIALHFLRLGATGREAKIILASIVALSAATFVSFLHGGYSLPSIVISAFSLPLWAWVAVAGWRYTKGRSSLDISYFRVALAYLVLACIGAILRVVFIATGGSAFEKSLAIFAFLHNFAWFFIFAILGLLIHRARSSGIGLDERRLRFALRLAAPIAWLGFPLGVMGGSAGLLGMLARGAAAGLVVPMGLVAMTFWQGGATSGAKSLRGAFHWLGFWLGLSALLSFAGGFGLAELAVRSRHLAILYLHVLLVGFVSFGLMVAILWESSAKLAAGTLIHNIGLIVMVLGLGCAGAPALGWSDAPLVPYGLALGALGGALLFLAGVVWFLGALSKPARFDAGEALAAPSRVWFSS